MEKIIIWGTGREYRQLKNRIEIAKKNGLVHIVALVNKETNHEGNVDGYRLIPSFLIQEHDFDKIILCARQQSLQNIWNEIKVLGIDPTKVEIGKDYFEKIMPYRFRINVDASIRNGCLLAEATSDIDLESGVHFHLYRNNGIIKRDMYDGGNSARFELEESGLYYVYAFDVENGMGAYSIPLEYINEADKGEYSRFLEEDGSAFNLPFFAFKPPFYDWLIANKDIGDDVCGLNLVDKLSAWSIYSSTESKEIHHAKAIVSGELIAEGRLYLGQDDIDESIYASNLIDGIGGYSAIIINGDKIEVCSDYFGIGKIYIYESNEIVAISNHLHLLLLSLKKAGVHLDIDEENVLSGLFCTHAYFAEQPLSKELTMNGVRCLEQGERIEADITDGKIRIISAGMQDGLIEICDRSGLEDYERDLGECVEEIVSTVRAIDAYDGRLERSVDLSGGMDSRIVFSALMNVDDANQRYKIHTAPFPKKEDYLVGTTIGDENNFYYDFDIGKREDLRNPVNWEMPFDDYLDAYISYNMGTYYGPSNEFSPKGGYDESILLCGAFGEPVSRDLFSNKYWNTDLDTIDNPEAFVDYFLQTIQGTFMLDYNKAGKYFRNNFLSEISSGIFKNYLHNLEMLETKYRGRYHHDVMRESWFGMRSLRIPLMYCPKTFLVFHKYLETIKSRKFAHDLIEALHTGMDAYDYADDNYNFDRERLDLLVKREKRPFHYRSYRFEEQRTKYELKGRQQLVEEPGSVSKQVQYMREFLKIGDINAYISLRFMNALRYICNRNKAISDNAGALLWLYARKPPKDTDAGSYRYRVVYNKVMSLAAQISIFE